MNWKIQIAKIILDEVITTVSEQEFNRLASGLNINEKPEDKVRYALESLGKLGIGEMSDYHDEWVALFYHWYQPAHINLAYSMIKSTGILNEKLHIVDFGCGSLAMQFGVALAVADKINKKSITEIRIDSIDTSPAMIKVGQKMWELFKLRACRYPDLYNACEIIKPKYYSDIKKVELAKNSDCWISAIHSVYEANKADVKQSLKSLVDRLRPDTCFLSTNSSKESLLSEVWPFASTNSKNVDPQPQFNGALTQITRWRRKLNNTHSQSHGYLYSPVTWEWRDAAIWRFYSWKYLPTHLQGW
ncbi:MAG: hypothetical protein OXG87_00305 [Gemmatimonadetes bacterium]|nr:hypothetical protein [Gemmatimonadota bacterium]